MASRTHRQAAPPAAPTPGSLAARHGRQAELTGLFLSAASSLVSGRTGLAYYIYSLVSGRRKEASEIGSRKGNGGRWLQGAAAAPARVLSLMAIGAWLAEEAAVGQRSAVGGGQTRRERGDDEHAGGVCGSLAGGVRCAVRAI